jgi:hypothetical protein
MAIFSKKSKYRIKKFGENYLIEVISTSGVGFFETKEYLPCDIDGHHIPIFDFIDCEYGKQNGFKPAKFKTKKEAKDFIKQHDC